MAETAPAIGVSMVVTVPGDRQITMQGFYAQDSGAEAGNALVDQLCAVTDRVKARYELPVLLDELAVQEKTLARFLEDQPGVEERYQARRDDYDQKIAELVKARDAEGQKAFNEHTASGKRGQFELRGLRKTSVENMNAGIHQIEEQKAQFEADTASHRSSADVAHRRFVEEVDAVKARIAKARAALGEE